MNQYQKLVIDAAVAKAKNEAGPLLEKMGDDERERCAAVMEIFLGTILRAMDAMANQPVKVVRTSRPKPSAFDRVMNGLTFGLWD